MILLAKRSYFLLIIALLVAGLVSLFNVLIGLLLLLLFDVTFLGVMVIDAVSYTHLTLPTTPYV